MPDFSVGSASVKISPSFKNFVRDAKAELKAMDLSADARLVLQTADAQADYLAFAKQDRSTDLRVDLDDATARAGMDALSRARVAEVEARILAKEVAAAQMDEVAKARIAQVQARTEGIEAQQARLDNLARVRIARIQALVDRTTAANAESEFKKIASDLKKAGTLNLKVGALVGGAGLISEILAIGDAAAQAAHMVALIPAGGFGALSTIGSIAAGIHGIPGVFKDLTAAGNDTTDPALRQAESANAVADAQFRAQEATQSKADADRNAAQAETNYDDATKDATRSIRDQNESLQQTKLSASDAAISVDEAAKNLNKVRFDPTADSDARQRALNEYQEALLNSQKAQEKENDTAQDAAEVNAKGVQGSKEVVAAKDAITSATEAQTRAAHEASDAAVALQKALAEQAQGDSTQQKLAHALSQLSPNARQLVQDIRGIGPAWHDAQQAAQDSLTSGLGPAVERLADVQLPGVKAGMVEIDTAVNSGLKGTLAALSTDSAKLDFRTALDNTALGLSDAAKASGPLTDGLTKLVKVGSEDLPGFGTEIGNLGARFDNLIDRTAADGTLKHWIDDGTTSAQELAQTVEHVGSAIGSVFRAAGDGGASLKELDDLTAKLSEFLKSAQGQAALSNFFAQARAEGQKLEPLLQDLPGLLKGVTEGTRLWSETALPFLKLAADLLSAHPELVETAIAAYVGFKTVKPIIDGASTAIDLLAKRAGAAADVGGVGKFRAAGQGLLSLLGSPWTAAIVGAGAVLLQFESSANQSAQSVQRFREQEQQAADDTENLKRALGTSHGSLDSGVLDAQTQSLKNFRDAAAANAKDLPGFGDTMTAAFADIGNDLFGAGGGIVANYDTRQQVDQYGQSITSAFDQLGLSNSQLAQKITGDKPAFDAVITQLQGMGNGGKDAASKLQELRDEWAVDASSVAPVTAAIEDLGNKQKDTASAIDAATDALERQRQGGLTVESAQEKVNAALTQLGTSAQSAGGAVIDASGKIDTTTASGQALYNLINGTLAPSWEQLSAAVYRDGIQHGQTADQAQQAAQKASDAAKTSAEQQIEQMGYTQAQADTLLQHYIPLGKNFNATFTADTSQAMTAVQQLEKLISDSRDKAGNIPGGLQYYAYTLGLPGQYSPGFGTPVAPSTSGLPANVSPFFPGHADGGPVYGPGTDTSDSIVVRLSTGEYVINAAAVRKYGMSLFDGLNNEMIDPSQLGLSPQLPAAPAQAVAPQAAAPTPAVGSPDQTGVVAPQIGTAPQTVINPQAPAPAPMTDEQLQILQDRAAVDQANTDRNAVYASPTSTQQDKQAADYKYIQSQNSLQSAQKKTLPEKYTIPGIAASAAGILAQGLLSSVGLGQSILSDQGTYATDINTAGQWITQNNPQFAGTYTYVPKNLPNVVTPTPSELPAATGTSATSAIGTSTSATGGQSTVTWSPSAGAEQWRSLAAQMLAKEGFAPTAANVNTMLAQITTESGGNPTAENDWDSNAQAGHPSRGLLQTIPSTFATWRDPTLPDDINDPAANMAAALRYYRATYGDDLTTQWGHGHGYDDGGIASGIGLMLKQTIRPERVLSPQQTETFDSALPLLESINASAWSPNRIDSSSLNIPAPAGVPVGGRTFAPVINARVADVSDLADLVERQAHKDAIGLMSAMP